MTKIVALPDMVAARLAKAAVDHVAAADQLGGCCVVCCGTCASVLDLIDLRMLDAVVRLAPGAVDSAWWVGDRVDRELLDRVWESGTGAPTCHGIDETPATGDRGITRYVTVDVGHGVAVMVPAGTDQETVRLIRDEAATVVRYFLSS